MTLTHTRPVIPTTLYHYTCLDHGAPGISVDRVLRPNAHFLLEKPLVWLTDLNIPDTWVLGLTNVNLCCDRTAVQVVVRTDTHRGAMGIEPWWCYARHTTRMARELIEDVGLPAHWWVTEQPVLINDIHHRRGART
jgi:hypothetical protein